MWISFRITLVVLTLNFSFLFLFCKISVNLDYIKGQLCLEIDQGLIIQSLFCELLRVELKLFLLQNREH